MPSQRDVEKRRVRAEHLAQTGTGRQRVSRRGRRRRLIVGAVAMLVVLMMVMSLAVGVLA